MPDAIVRMFAYLSPALLGRIFVGLAGRINRKHGMGGMFLPRPEVNMRESLPSAIYGVWGRPTLLSPRSL
jgi:hypothetical protein